MLAVGGCAGYVGAHSETPTLALGRPLLVEDDNLVLNAGLLSLQSLLGNALDGHELPRRLLLCQDHLGEGAPGRGEG